MTKTTNLELPQWEASDTINRTDFNDAFATLDNGYAAAVQAAEAARTLADGMAADTSAAITAAAAEAEDRNFARFCRVANHTLRAMAEHDDAWRLGAFFLPFDSAHGNTISGTLQRDDMAWMGNSSTLLTSQLLTQTATKVASISSTDGSDTCTITFTPPYSGRLTRVRLVGSYHGNTNGNTGACTVTLTNLTTGTVEAVQAATFNFTAGGFSGSTYADVDLLLHVQQKYQLDVKLDAMDFTDISLAPNLSSTSYTLTAAGYKLAAATASATLAAGEESLGGVVLAHYVPWGNGGAISLTWDGETISPACTRTVTDQAGRTVQEAEFRKNTAIPASSSLSLNLTCKTDGELELYDWGAVMV
jgi:hypothetical protein